MNLQKVASFQQSSRNFVLFKCFLYSYFAITSLYTTENVILSIIKKKKKNVISQYITIYLLCRLKIPLYKPWEISYVNFLSFSRPFFFLLCSHYFSLFFFQISSCLNILFSQLNSIFPINKTELDVYNRILPF